MKVADRRIVRRTDRRTARPACRSLEALEVRRLMAAYYLAPGGSNGAAGTIDAPWQTLAHAAATVSAGDEVILRAGTYPGGATFNDANLLIRSHTGERATISSPINNASVEWALRLGASASGSTIRGVELVGGYYYGIKLESEWGSGPNAARNITIEDSILRGSGRDVIKITPGCDDVVIRRNEIYDSGLRDSSNAEGIDNVNGDRMIVQDNHIHDTATQGVYAKGSAEDCVIEGNVIHDTGGIGVALGFYTDAEFFDAANTDYYESIDSTVRNNVIYNTTYAGVGLYGALRPRVYNNTMVNVAGSGMAGVVLVPGTVYVNDSFTAYPPTRDPQVYNNIISPAGTAPAVQIRNVDGNPGLAGIFALDNNVYHRAGGGTVIFRDDRPATRWTGGLGEWKTYIGADAASVEGNPQLDADYHLTGSGPAIDAGRDLSGSGFANDVDNQARPLGGAWDVGADEFGEGGPPPADTTAPVMGAVATPVVGATTVTITWTTNEAADRQVEYGTTTAYGALSPLGASRSTSHSVTLTGLTPQTPYHYRVLSRDAAGNRATSADFTFTTGDTDPPPVLQRELLGAFGVINGRRTRLTITEGGVPITVTLSSGTGQVFREAGRIELDLAGTDARSAVAVTARGRNARVALGDVVVPGPLRAFTAKAGDLAGTMSVGGSVGRLLLGSIPGGTVAAAGELFSVTVLGAVTNGRVLAGLNLGADNQLGGDVDVAGTASIRKLRVGGSASGSVFAAGVGHTNGVFGDSDDFSAGGSILSATIRGDADGATRFIASEFGRALRLGRTKVDPATDARFVDAG